MSVHSLNRSAPVSLPAAALQQLRRWAAERPLRIALRHRRLGEWKAWRWIDVLREVERAAAGLREQGFGAGSRLLLCGAYEPSLLVLALAAHELGGELSTLSRLARGEALREQLRLERPAFAYVQRREQVEHWLRAGVEQTLPLRLFSAQALPRKVGAWDVLPLDRVFAGEPLERGRLAWREAARDAVLWCEEGTEWREGLSHLLSRWLEQGEALAFPESNESAARDRRDIAPTALLASAPRLHSLAADIEARLAPAGSWRRRLCDWTLSDARTPPRRWLKARVRRLLGFQRLQRIDAPSADPRAPTQSSWLRPYLERVA